MRREEEVREAGPVDPDDDPGLAEEADLIRYWHGRKIVSLETDRMETGLELIEVEESSPTLAPLDDDQR